MALATHHLDVRRPYALDLPDVRARPLTFLLAGLLSIDVLLGVAYALTRPLQEPDSLVVAFDLNGEGNLPAWFASTQLLAMAVPWALLAVAHAVSSAAKPARRALPAAVLAMLFVGLSADEGAQVHEMAGYVLDALVTGPREETAFAQTGLWMFVIGVPGALVLAFAVRGVARDLARAGQIGRFAAGLALFLVAALGAETSVNFLPLGAATEAEIAIEEVGELAGASIMLVTGLATLQGLVTVRVALRLRSVDAHEAPH